MMHPVTDVQGAALTEAEARTLVVTHLAGVSAAVASYADSDVIRYQMKRVEYFLGVLDAFEKADSEPSVRLAS